MKQFIYLFLFVLIFASCSKEEAVVIPNNLPDEFKAFKNLFNGEGVGAAVSPANDVLILFSQSGTKYAWFEDSQIKATWSINDQTGPLRNLPLDDVGASLILTDDKIFFISKDGESYVRSIFDREELYNASNNPNGFFDTYNSIQNTKDKWGINGTFPWDAIGAAWPKEVLYDCNQAELVYNNSWLVSFDGNTILSYTSGTGVSGTPLSLNDYSLPNLCGTGIEGQIPFNKISAATPITRANGDVYMIYFSANGKSFSFAQLSIGEFSPIYNL